MNFKQIEEILGYTFKDKRLLAAAFTHSSYANESGENDSERLEFLGDAVLDFIVADILFDKNGRDEGQMTVRRSKIVSKTPLAREADRLGLNNFLRYGRGFKPSQDMSVKLRSNVFEAVLGAIYKDSGIDAAREFLKRTLLCNLKDDETMKDFKSRLQEISQNRGSRVNYHTEEISAAPPRFLSRVALDGKEIATGEGGSKKASQQEAAKNALKTFKG